MITSTPSGMKKDKRIPRPKERIPTLMTLKRLRWHIPTPPTCWRRTALGSSICKALPKKNSLLLEVDEEHADVGRVHTADAGGLPQRQGADRTELLGRLKPQSP